MTKALEYMFILLIAIPLLITAVSVVWLGCIKIIKWLWNK